jgi:MinD superfamily P-loop ATPase
VKQIVVLSGKGGTGKTFVTSSLASIAEQAVFADCDVDAANLHLMLAPTVRSEETFVAGVVATIDADRCTACGICVEHCRFDAIELREPTAVVDPVACEGCGVCHLVCPEGAVRLERDDAGSWYRSDTAFGPLVHALLSPGAENSGKLVEVVRRAAVDEAARVRAEWVVIDGPPGIGCSAKSAITGTDFVLLVTEPTVSGAHDVERVVQLAEFFRVPMGMIVNKSTLDRGRTEELREFARTRDIAWLGEIPFDRSIVDAVTALKAYPLVHDNAISRMLRTSWERIRELAAGHTNDS